MLTIGQRYIPETVLTIEGTEVSAKELHMGAKWFLEREHAYWRDLKDVVGMEVPNALTRLGFLKRERKGRLTEWTLTDKDGLAAFLKDLKKQTEVRENDETNGTV